MILRWRVCVSVCDVSLWLCVCDVHWFYLRDGVFVFVVVHL